jgi:phospholipid/cholesterol/gamma-HCH transport system substrate-binding protein
MARSRKHEIGVGVLVLVAFGMLAWMSLEIGALRGLGDRVAVQARLDDAMGLEEGAVVKVAGVAVGNVTGIAVDHDVAVVDFQLDPSAGLRVDAVVQVRARSLLGEKFLELQPQSRDAALLQDGDVLSAVRPATEIDELVNGLAPVVSTLDPEALQATMDALSGAMKEDPELAARMMRNLDEILANGAEASRGLPPLVAEGTAAARDVRRLAADARPVIARAEAVADKADTALGRIDEASQDLPQTVAEVDALAKETRAAVSEGRAVLARVEGMGPEIETIIDNVAEIDKWEVRRWLREEGIKVRLRESQVQPTE